MKILKDFTVTLHNQHKRAIHRKVRACVSPAAACAVADMKYSRDYFGRFRWQATFAYVQQ